MKINTLNTILNKFTLLLVLTWPAMATAEPPEWAVLGEAAEVTGELEVLYFDDFEHHKGEYRYIVHDKQKGKRFQLEFEGKPPKDATTGSFVRVRGKANDDQIFMEANSTSSFETLASAATPTVSGDQKTIVLVANFQDATVSCPVQDIEDTMFTDPNGKSVDELYRETSLGNLQFTGEVAGPFAITSRITDNCNISAWADAADSKAIASGINLSNFTRKVYVLPSNNGCGHTGIANVGGSSSRAWIFRCDMPDVFAHELGHNLGMRHAGSASSEYGDFSDVMGYSNVGLRQINGPHQEQMGWRSPEAIIEVTGDGVFDIAPLELDALSTIDPQVLKIRKPDTGEYYYLSYRQRTGFDSNIPAGFTTGINIHRFAEGAAHTHLINALADGGSFVDSNNGITINQISHDQNSVLAEVIFSTTPCTQTVPEITASPLSHTAQAGDTVNYSITINNRDSASCPNSTWTVDTLIPMGWAGSVNTSEITVAPGSSNTLNWSVSSASSSAAGNYSISMNLASSDTSVHDSDITANYTVASPSDTEAPTAPTELTASAQRKKVSVSWQPSTDNIAVAGYKVFRNDIQIATTTSISYSDSNVVSGKTYTYYIVAFDAANNSSSQSNSSIIIYASNGGGSNRGGGKKR